MPDGSEVREERFDEVEEFLRFIRSFRDEVGDLKYKNRLEQIIASGSRSLIVDFDDLLGFSRELGSRLVKNPRELLPELEKHCRPELAAIDPAYASKLRRFNIRIRGLPESTPMRTIRTEHLNTLVSIEGIVVRSTPIKSLLLVGRFSCKRCGGKQDLPQSGELLRFPALCSDPSCGGKGSANFELLEAESDFVDIQELRLQERPEDLPPGQLPRTADVLVFDDMVDIARPGDRTTLSGIVIGEPEPHPTGGRYRTFVLRLHCNHLEVAGLEEEVVAITPEDEKALLSMSKDSWIFKKLVASLAPSIYGLEDEKEAIILQLMGGNPKELPDGVRIRGDVNVFLIGDPGCYSGDTRIVLGDGSMPTFKELADVLGIRDPGIYPVSLTVKNRGEEKATALHLYERQPIVEITLASGRKIGATPNNPFFTSKGWRRADQLKVGTRIHIRRRIRSHIRKYYPTGWCLVSHDSSRNNIVSVPEVVDEKLAGLMGLLTAEGYVDGSHSLALAVNQLEKQLAISTARTITKLFGYRASTSVLRRKGKGRRKLDLFRLKMTNPHIIAWLRSMVAEKRVPSLIFMSPDKVVASYLQWLFEGDGNVRCHLKTRDRYVGLTSKNIELLRDVQLLLLRFGIESHIHLKSDRKSAGECFVLRVSDERSLRLFVRHIGFVSKAKARLLTDVLYSYKDTREIPKRTVMDKIVKIESKAPEVVYDLEVPTTNAMIVNGIIGHNTAKSQLLKYVQKIAPRGLYTSGRGSTAAGLTATAVRERHGGYVLEAGALVLADRGIAAIDEFEKMRPEDRIAIHEAMEQQTCSVAKGGIVATLNARTAILAAANPALGRYDSNKLFVENANLPPTILSRFDLIFVLKDIPDEDSDKRLADHMLDYHRGSLSTSSDIIGQSMLRKYLSYCRKLRPRLTQECADRLEEFFLEMRRQSSVGGAPMAITPRQLESLVRLSEARAKAHVRNEVLVEDAEAAIALMKRSLAQAGMDVETGQIDVDALMTGKPKSTRDKMGKLLELVAQLEDRSGSANLDELEGLAEKEGVQKEDFGKLISAMLREGLLYSPDEQSVKRARR